MENIKFLSKTRQQRWYKQTKKNMSREHGEKKEKGKFTSILIVERGQDLKN